MTRIGSPNSLLNKPLADDEPLASTSADHVARLVRQVAYSPTSSPVSGPYPPPFNTAFNTTQYGVAWYDMPLDHPRIRVQYRDGSFPDSHEHGLPGKWASVPVPDINECKPGTGYDGVLVPHQIQANGTDGAVVITCGPEMWEFYKFTPDSSVPSGYRAHWGAYTENYTTFNGIHRNYWGSRASGVMLLGGIVTRLDEARGSIDHAITIALPCTGEGASTPQQIDPCYRGDTGSPGLTPSSGPLIDADRMPHGARFRLAHDFDVTAWVQSKIAISGVNPVLMAELCKAIRDYGLMTVDTSGIVTFVAEDPRSYGTPYNPYATRPPGLGNYTKETCLHLPWAHLQQLEPVDVLNVVRGIVMVDGTPMKVRTY